MLIARHRFGFEIVGHASVAGLCFLCGLQQGPAKAQSGTPERLGLPGKTFEVAGHSAFLLLPKQPSPEPQPWIVYAPALPDFPDLHEKWMHEQFLAAGVAVAGIDADEAYGSPHGRKLFDALYDELTTKQGYAKRPCLFGRSRGGLWVSSWAADHPDRVAGIIGIYPAFDLTTYPGIEPAAPAYELSPTQLSAALDQYNPIERVELLAKARIPAAFIHGDRDVMVPLEPNSQRFADIYQAHGAGELVTLIVCQDQEHSYWPDYFKSQTLVGKAIAWARGTTESTTITREPATGEP